MIQAKSKLTTPPWATRALLEIVLEDQLVDKKSCLEPACGAGHMSKVLKDYFYSVRSSDIYDYGFGEVIDFCSGYYGAESFDWVITNPPFKLAEQFVSEGLRVSKFGVALLTRTVFIESVGRYERLFKNTPPSALAQFAERVPMVKGRLDKGATTATGYAWLVWLKEKKKNDKPFPIKDTAIRQAWDRLRNRADLNDLNFHDLRHEAIYWSQLGHNYFDK